ncbi:MAG TPA: DUF748 domain-containing protein [Chryseosolibacter sp.]
MAKRRKIKTTAIAAIVVALIIVTRLALPYVILRYANNSLEELDGYRGHVNDIDLAILRGAYKLDSIYINKIDSVTEKETPFLAASLVDLSIEWKALFKGSLVGEIVVDNGMVRFTKDKVEPKQVQKDSSDFRKVLKDFMPLKINRLEFRNSTLRYVDNTSKPKVDIRMTDVHVIALNLRNSYDSADVLPATINAKATVYDGRLDLSMKLNPLAEVPTFDMNAEWRHTNLVKLNEFFQAYAKVDVNKGTFGLYTEIAAKEGKFTGYVKPLVQNIDVLGHEDRKDNILRKIWEGLADVVTEVFENQKKETVATKIPLRGKFDNPKANIFFAIAQILQNAFISALQPSIDEQINLRTVDKEQEKKGFLERVFGGKGDKEDKHANDIGDKKDKQKN